MSLLVGTVDDRRLAVVNETAGSTAAVDVVEPDELRRVLTAGALAPSVHNTQPWKFVLTGTGIEVHGDARRVLAHQDPRRRELVISCGAAIMNMRVATAAIGRDVRVHIQPDAADPLHLATLVFGRRYRKAPDDARLYPGVGQRHTHRHSFAAPENAELRETQLVSLVVAAEQEGAELAVVPPARRRAALRLVRLANRKLAQDAEYVRELASWTRTNDWAPDGVVVAGFGSMPEVDDPPLRDFGLGYPWIGRGLEHFVAEEWVVVSTDGDDVVAWLRAGQALERVLLTLALSGWTASFLTQPIEVPQLREELRAALGIAGHPQVMLRVGPGRAMPAAGRRPLEDVVQLGDGAARLLVGTESMFG